MSILFLLVLMAGFAVPAVPAASPYIDAGPGGVTWNGRIYEYGGVPKTDEPYDGDAWFTIRDETTGALLRRVVYDGGNDETFIYFAILSDDVFALVTETRGIPGSGGSSLCKTEILAYTGDGEPHGATSVPGRMTAYNNHGGMLVLSADETFAADYVFDAGLAPTVLPATIVATGSFDYPYRCFATVDGDPVERIAIAGPGIYDIVVTDGFYAYAFRAVVDPIVTGVADGTEWSDPPTVTSPGILSLDGEPFVSGEAVVEPGNHVLSIRGDGGYEKTIAFVLHPYVANIVDGFATEAGIRVFTDADALEIDGEPYVQGDLYRIPGRHVMTVLAANGYARTIAFAILPSVAGVESGGVYEDEVAFTVNGTAVLGGLSVTGTIVLDEPGAYELVLYFDGAPYATYAFAVTASAVPDPWWRSFPWIETVSGAAALVGLFLIFRKK